MLTKIPSRYYVLLKTYIIRQDRIDLTAIFSLHRAVGGSTNVRGEIFIQYFEMYDQNANEIFRFNDLPRRRCHLKSRV